MPTWNRVEGVGFSSSIRGKLAPLSFVTTSFLPATTTLKVRCADAHE
jgi:hypothetical protein